MIYIVHTVYGSEVNIILEQCREGHVLKHFNQKSKTTTSALPVDKKNVNITLGNSDRSTENNRSFSISFEFTGAVIKSKLILELRPLPCDVKLQLLN